MKKTILSISLIASAAIASMLISSCGKDDTPPVITLLGDNPMTVSLNGDYIELGAAATDDEDGDVTANISISGAVDEDLAGTYTVTYSVSDKEGNTGSDTRTVIVKNDAEDWAGTYTVTDDCSSGSYQQSITASANVNNRILFNKFADYSGNTGIYATINGSSITVPSQTGLDIGSFQEDHTFTGTGTQTGTGFNLIYNDYNIQQASSANCTATFTKN